MKSLVIAYFAAIVLAAPALIWAADSPPADPATTTSAATATPPGEEATPAAVVPVAPGPPDEDFAKADAATSADTTDEVVKTTDVKAKPKPKPKARAAGSKSVTIKNFEFGPKTVTVSKGDTVTWTNQDSAPHTATKTGGSGAFDTGNLKKGQSGTHKFDSTGSFAYICAIHPNMKGTVVVKAASSGSGGSGSDSSGDSGSSGGSGSSDSGGTSSDAFQLSDDSSSSDSGSSSSDSQDLASTGGNIGLTLMLGVGLFGAGVVMRRRSATS
jgi:plastocyanin